MPSGLPKCDHQTDADSKASEANTNAFCCTTRFPALQYFCIYATIGIVLDFLLQVL